MKEKHIGIIIQNQDDKILLYDDTFYIKVEIHENDNINNVIVEEIGAVSESSTGWTKELNLISWNNREAKYDLRDWAPDHAKMGKGITLSINELRELKKLLNNMDI